MMRENATMKNTVSDFVYNIAVSLFKMRVDKIFDKMRCRKYIQFILNIYKIKCIMMHYDMTYVICIFSVLRNN